MPPTVKHGTTVPASSSAASVRIGSGSQQSDRNRTDEEKMHLHNIYSSVVIISPTRAATEIIRGGVLREFKFIGSSPGQFWNPVAIPIPCLDPFRLFLARVYGNCGPGGYSGSYYSYPNVGYAYSSGYYPYPYGTGYYPRYFYGNGYYRRGYYGQRYYCRRGQ